MTVADGEPIADTALEGGPNAAILDRTVHGSLAEAARAAAVTTGAVRLSRRLEV